jgi:hypothetical protein
MGTLRRLVIVIMLATLLAVPGLAAQAGRATGTVTLDGKVTTLAFATSAATENLFDDTKKDTIVVLSDRELGEIPPADMIELQMQARRGAIVALALRLDGAKLVNVAVHAAGLDGVSLLPGAWFTYKPGAGGSGSLGLARRESEGRSYAWSSPPLRLALLPRLRPRSWKPGRSRPRPCLPRARAASSPRRWPPCWSRR